MKLTYDKVFQDQNFEFLSIEHEAYLIVHKYLFPESYAHDCPDCKIGQLLIDFPGRVFLYDDPKNVLVLKPEINEALILDKASATKICELHVRLEKLTVADYHTKNKKLDNSFVCTSCGHYSGTLRYNQWSGIDDQRVRLIPKGEQWCEECCKDLPSIDGFTFRLSQLKQKD